MYTGQVVQLTSPCSDGIAVGAFLIKNGTGGVAGERCEHLYVHTCTCVYVCVCMYVCVNVHAYRTISTYMMLCCILL